MMKSSSSSSMFWLSLATLHFACVFQLVQCEALHQSKSVSQPEDGSPGAARSPESALTKLNPARHASDSTQATSELRSSGEEDTAPSAEDRQDDSPGSESSSLAEKVQQGIGADIEAGRGDTMNTMSDPEKKFMKGVDAYIKAGKKDVMDTVPESEKRFLKGVDAYIKAGKKDVLDAVAEPDKKFIKGVDAYIKAGKKDVIDAISEPDKKFIKGVDAYIKAGKKDVVDAVSEPDKKFIKGVDAYIKAGKKNVLDSFPEAEKKFIRGVDTYIQAGKRGAEDSAFRPDKKFMRGVSAYIRTGNNLLSPQPNKKSMKGVDANIPAEKKDTGTAISDPEKKFIRGVDTYVQSAKPLSLPPQKKFIRGIDAHIQSVNKGRIGTLTYPDKRFILGMNAYANALRENEADLNPPTKKFMQGIDAYIQPGKKDSNEPVTSPEKKFIRGVGAYLRTADRHQDKAAPSPEKKFIRGIDRYIQTGEDKAVDGMEDPHDMISSTADKRFLRGNDLYFSQNRATGTKRADEQIYQFENEGVDSDGMAGEIGDAGKRFMKGFEHYLKKSVTQDDDHWITEHALDRAMDKKFMRGIDMYLPGRAKSNGRYMPLAAVSTKRNTKDSSEQVHKRFMKGIGHYLKQSASGGKRSGSGVGSDHTQDDLESQLNVEDKRFLKGYEIYLHHNPSHSQHSERVKRSALGTETGETEQLNKRFLRGPNPYLQFYANSLSSSKRFMKIPYLFGPSRPDQRLQSTDDVKRSDETDEDEAEPLREDKRFLRGIDKYLSAYMNNRPVKRFMKGVNPYIRAYSMSLGSKRFYPYVVGKRFMKGINPYLQAYYTGGGTKRLNIYDPHNTQKKKRFLKGVNPYIRAFSSRVQDKRLGEEDTLPWETPRKRFLRGADPYLSWYMNRPQDKRALWNGNEEEDLDDESDQQIVTPQKRFLRGNNPYMWDYMMSQSPKRQPTWVAGLQKRFLKGVDQYLLAYANSPRAEQVSERSLGKRFIKNYDYYLQLYDQLQKQENAGPVMKSASLKRSKRNTDSNAATYDARHKRFTRGVHRRLQTGSSLPDKRFRRGTDYYLSKPPEDKRFLKGVGPYLRHLVHQPDRRSDKSDKTELPTEKDVNSVEDAASPNSLVLEKEHEEKAHSGHFDNGNSQRSKRDVSLTNVRLDAPERSKRSAIPYFGLTGNFKTNTATSSTEVKRFMRGPNPYLSDFSSIRSASGINSKDIRTDAGDAVMKELARETAGDSFINSRKVPDGSSSSSEAESPEASSERMDPYTHDGYTTFPRQPHYLDLHTVRRDENQRVLDSPQRNWLPQDDIPQSMVWNNGVYHLG